MFDRLNQSSFFICCLVAEAGIEPDDVSANNTKALQHPKKQDAAESGAVDASFTSLPSDLQSVIYAWPNLTVKEKLNIQAIVKAASRE